MANFQRTGKYIEGKGGPANRRAPFGTYYLDTLTNTYYIQSSIDTLTGWKKENVGDGDDIAQGQVTANLAETLAVGNITSGYNIVLSDGEGYSDMIGSQSNNKYGYRGLIRLELNDDWVISYNEAQYDEDDSGLYIGDGYAAMYSSNANGFGYDAAFELYNGSPTMFATNSDFYSWMGTLDDLASYGDSWQMNHYGISFTQSMLFGAINTKNYGAERIINLATTSAYGLSSIASAQGYGLFYGDGGGPEVGEGHYNGVSLVSSNNTNLGYATQYADGINSRHPQYVSVIASDNATIKGATVGTHVDDSINYSLVAASLTSSLESTRKSSILSSNGVSLVDTDYVSVVGSLNFDSSVPINATFGGAVVKDYSLVSDHIYAVKRLNLAEVSALPGDGQEGDMLWYNSSGTPGGTVRLMGFFNGGWFEFASAAT